MSFKQLRGPFIKNPLATGSPTGFAVPVPSTASLTLTTFAPKLALAVIPGALALSLSTFAPTVSVSTSGTTVIPSTASLSTSTFAPTVNRTTNPSVKFLEAGGASTGGTELWDVISGTWLVDTSIKPAGSYSSLRGNDNTSVLQANVLQNAG